MKCSILLAALLFSISTYAQNEKLEPVPPLSTAPKTDDNEVSNKSSSALKSCWGIPFGTQMDSVKKVVKNKTAKLPSATTNDELLVYKDVRFGTFVADEIHLLFFKGIFYGSKMRFTPTNLPGLYDLYQSLKSDISEKYFEPQKDVEEYKSPYKKGDARPYVAITLGYATIGAIWEFPNNGKILCAVNADGNITLFYEDGFYSTLAAADASSDY